HQGRPVAARDPHLRSGRPRAPRQAVHADHLARPGGVVMNLRKGDHVVVLKGKDRGKDGVIMRVLPKEGKVIVEGVNVAKKHQKATRATMQAGITHKDMPLDASNVAILSRGKPSRIGFRIEDGKKVRVAVRTGEVLS